jgi:7-carboxy-7-deazaguanine synthase
VKIIPINPVVPVVQHIDKAITSAKYKVFKDNLLITSFFRTVQGEGPFAGHPSVFVRTAGCNLGAKDNFCRFCDTSFEFDQGKIYSPQMLLDSILKLPGVNTNDVLVITGGEPTLQHNLISFLELADPYFRAIQIETNGTQAPFFDKLLNTKEPRIHVVVSPKASYKTNEYALPSDRVMAAARAFKFVVASEGPHRDVPSWAFANKSRYGYELYVSPMAVYKRSYDGEVSSIWDPTLIDQEATSGNYAYAARYAMDHNCLLSLQTHLFLGVA